MKRRNFLKVTSITALANGLELPDATACSMESGPSTDVTIVPRETLINLTERPYARYLDTYYEKYESSPLIKENFHIKTSYNPENPFVVPVKILCPHVKNTDPLHSNLFIKKIDVLEQIRGKRNDWYDGSYRDKYGNKSSTSDAFNEGPVHFIASIENISSPVEYFSFRYRRRFYSSRLILIFTLFNIESNQPHSISVGMSKELSGVPKNCSCCNSVGGLSGK